MKILKIALISIFLLFINCNSDYKNLSKIDEPMLRNGLKEVVIENLRSWEPPFNDEKFISAFSQSEDLLIIIDEFVINKFEQWKNVAVVSMQEDREKEYKMYTHIIENIYVAVLSKTSGVVTLQYVWDYITKDDLHFNVKATAMFGCKRVDSKWEIVQFIVKHGEEQQIK